MTDVVLDRNDPGRTSRRHSDDGGRRRDDARMTLDDVVSDPDLAHLEPSQARCLAQRSSSRKSRTAAGPGRSELAHA